MEHKIKELKEWVLNNYYPRRCGWTELRSEGNYSDVFRDGIDAGTSWAAHEVGCILEMDLETPDEPNYEDY